MSKPKQRASSRDLELKIAKLESELKLANDELWRVKEINSAIQKTFSWRVTAPLRFIRAIPSRLRKTAVGRTIYKLKLAKINLYHKLQYSPGNIIALERLVSYRSAELLSPHHIKQYERKCKIGDIDTLPNIDLSVVTYNNGKWAGQFIQTLKEQKFPLKKINLIFIDNSSTDNTYKIIQNLIEKNRHLFSSIALHQRPNLGFGAGHDFAISLGKCDFILISNIDVEFRENTIINLVGEAAVDAEDIACWEVRQAPYEHPKYVDPVTRQVNWASHCAVLMRRKAYYAVGGYEPAIFMYGEDVELSYRFISRGWKLRYVPDAWLLHYTYKEANEVKPIQYVGSLYANGLIRIRYGNILDALMGLILQLGILFGNPAVPNVRAAIIKNLLKLVFRFPLERMRSVPLRGSFPFRGFDYDLRRDGAFYDISNLQCDGPLVSVITRTYKGRDRFLRECIASVLNQTYKNIEHIIVEDGDSSHELLIGQVTSAYPNAVIRYFSEEKVGRSVIGNRGLKESHGKWCVFLDDDDLFLPDHIEILVGELQKNKNLSAAYSLAWEVKTELMPDGYEEKAYLTEPVFYQEYSPDVLLHHNYIPIQCILFNRSLFEDRGGFDEQLEQLEDWNLWVKFSIKNKFKWIGKTTSIFRTPYSPSISAKRKKLLDEAYSEVQRRNMECVYKYGK